MDQISVNYVGRMPIDWHPAKASTENAAATSPTTPDPRIVAAVQAKFDEIDSNKGLSATERAERIAPYVALRALILDPDAHLTGTKVTGLQDVSSDLIDINVESMASSTKSIMDTWKTAPDVPDVPDVPQDAADRWAQKIVPKRYDSRCLLTGTIMPLGAHILPVEAVDLDFYTQLQMFWSLPKLEELVVDGREEENILPLSPTLHAFWDFFYFALRPIVHPQDPAHRLYLQLVWLKDVDGGDIDHNGSHACFGGGCDFRRARDGETAAFPALQHGDVYELVTADPAACPLPSVSFLQIKYYITRIMAVIRTASSLKTIFSGDPPPDSDGDADGTQDLDEVYLKPAWRSVIDAAVDTGVLDEQAAVRWGRAMARAASDRGAKLLSLLAKLRGEKEDEEDGKEDS